MDVRSSLSSQLLSIIILDKVSVISSDGTLYFLLVSYNSDTSYTKLVQLHTEDGSITKAYLHINKIILSLFLL